MNNKIQEFIFDDIKNSISKTAILEPLKNKTILITGASGFIGSWLSHSIHFLNTCFDFKTKLILLSRNSQAPNLNNSSLFESSFIQYIELDVRKLIEIPKQTDYIIHLAGNPNNKYHIAEPFKTMDTIVRGTQNLLYLAIDLPNLKNIIYLSSHSVYGNINQELISEKDRGLIENLDVRNIYQESKRVAEIFCDYFFKTHRLPITIIRPFSFIGPFQQQNVPWAINNFIRDALLAVPIRVLGNPQTLRSYLYGSDLAYILLSTLIKAPAGEIYNLGSQEQITLENLANLIKRITNSNLNIMFKSSVNDFNTFSKLIPNMQKLTSLTEIKPYFSLNKAIERTLLFQQQFKLFEL